MNLKSCGFFCVFFEFSLKVLKHYSCKIILTQRAKRPNDFTFKFVTVLNLGPVRLYGDTGGGTMTSQTREDINPKGPSPSESERESEKDQRTCEKD